MPVQFPNIFNVEITKGPAIIRLNQMFYGNKAANRIGVNLFKNGRPYTTSGSCNGTAILSDGATVPLTGVVNGNQVYVELNQACYSKAGQIRVFVTCETSTTHITTVLAGFGTVNLTETDVVIDPGTIIPSVNEMIAAINAAVASIPADYSDLLAVIAPIYTDLTFPVSAGAYCWYSGELYKAKDDIAASEPWTAAHWAAAVLGNDLAGIRRDYEASIRTVKANAPIISIDKTNFQRGYWSGGSIVSSTTRICAEALYPVNAGDILILDEQNIQLGAWLYENGDTSVSAVELLGYTATKPAQYTLQNSGLLVIQGRMNANSDTITVNDFTGSVVVTSALREAVLANAETASQPKKLLFQAETLTAANFRQGYWSNGEIATATTRLCSRLIYDMQAGDRLTFASAGLQLGVWVKTDTDESYQNLQPYAMHKQPVTVIFAEHTRVLFQLKKPAGGTVTTANYDATITIERATLADQVKAVIAAETGRKEMPLGAIVQGTLAADGISSSTTRLAMKSVLALPYGEQTKLHIRINSGYKVHIWAGQKPYSIAGLGSWYYDGDTVTFPAKSNYFRLGIATIDGTQTITTDDLTDIALHVYYEDHASDFSPYDAAANAAMLNIPSGSGNMIYRTLPTFLHTSDVHGDILRVQRFAEYAERLGVSMACVTGDIVAYNTFPGSNHLEWFQDIVKASPVQWGVCVGNHDSHVGTGSGSYTMADTDEYAMFYDPIASELGSATGKLWYYKDLTAQKIRVISLDLYQEGGVWTYTYMTQAQLSWLCAADGPLATTPQGYGVVILMHAQQLSVVRDENHAAFYQLDRKGEPPEHYNAIADDGDPIGDIVNAFIQKTTLSATYEQTGEDSTLTVSADFTGVASGVEFIAYLTGHFHQDTIGYNTRPDGDPKQLILNITCGCSVYGALGDTASNAYKYLADCGDLPRNQTDATQDAFNLYAIDRAHKTVHVVRIGANTTHGGGKRDYMAIPYADTAAPEAPTEIEIIQQDIDDIAARTGVERDATALFGFTDGKANYYTTGKLASSETLAYSGFVPIPDGADKLRFSGIVRPDNTNTGLAFYTSASEAGFIESSGVKNRIDSTLSAMAAEDVTVQIPEGAKFVRTNWLATDNVSYSNYTFSAAFIWIGTLEEAVPAPPTTDGTYRLTCTVSSGTPTYSWVSA